MLLNGISCGGFVTPQKDVVEFSLALIRDIHAATVPIKKEGTD